MIWAAKQLLTPCNYLRIKQGGTLLQSKAVYDVILPAFLAVLTVGFALILSVPLAIQKHPGLVKSLSDLLALLIAFYMAALAAVATFSREGLDAPMVGDPATLRVYDSEIGAPRNVPLTYRQFISYLFGYLSFLSLTLFAFIIIISKAWPLIQKRLGEPFWFSKISYEIIDGIVFFGFFFAVWQLIITSLLGIFFLAERLQNLPKV